LHDPGDHLQPVLALKADPDQRDIGKKLPSERPDLLDLERAYLSVPEDRPPRLGRVQGAALRSASLRVGTDVRLATTSSKPVYP